MGELKELHAESLEEQDKNNNLTSFLNIKEKISDLNGEGIFTSDTTLDLDLLFYKFKNDEIDFNYNVKFACSGHEIEISYDSDFTKCFINFHTFNTIVFKYSSFNDWEKNYYSTDISQELNIIIDFNLKAIYCKNYFTKYKTKNNCVPITFNNIQGLIENENIKIYFLELLNIISKENKSIDFNIEDLFYSTSEKNIFSIFSFHNKKDFLKTINQNNF